MARPDWRLAGAALLVLTVAASADPLTGGADSSMTTHRADSAAVDLPALEVKARRRPGSGVQEGVRVDREYFEDNRRTTVAAALDKLPGVAVLHTGVGIAKPVIRGMANQRIVSLVDGIKQEGQQWGSDHGLELDPYMVSAATVVKGPGALRHGSDAMGGVIAFSTLAPAGEMGKRFRIEQGYHSNNHQASGALTAEMQGPVQGWVLHLGGQGYGDYRVPADSFTYNGFRLPVASGRLKNSAGLERSGGLAWTRSGPATLLRIAGRLYDLEAGLFAGAVGPPRAYLLQDDGDSRDRQTPKQETTHAAGSLSLRWDGALWSLTGEGGHQWNHRREYSRSHHHGVAATGDPTLANELRLHTTSLRAEASRKVGTAGKASLGWAGQAQINRRGGFEYLIPDYTRLEGGLFGIWEQSLGRSLDLSAGLRWDLSATETEAHSVDMLDDGTGNPGPVQRAPATSRLEGNPSFALGLARRWPDLGLSTSLHLGKSFRVPHPSETVSNGVHHGNFRHEQGDTSLRSESGYQVDLSLGKSWKRVKLKVDPFLWYFEDYIHLAPSGRFSPLQDAGQIYRYRQHDAIFAGAELSLGWDADFLGFDLGWDYLRNLNLETGLPLPFSPPWSAHGALEFRQRRAGWMEEGRIRMEGRYVADQERVDRNEMSTPGHVLVDLGAHLRFRIGNVTPGLRAGIHNALDAEYRGHLSRYRILNLPEPGRGWMVGLVLPLGAGGI